MSFSLKDSITFDRVFIVLGFVASIYYSDVNLENVKKTIKNDIELSIDFADKDKEGNYKNEIIALRKSSGSPKIEKVEVSSMVSYKRKIDGKETEVYFPFMYFNESKDVAERVEDKLIKETYGSSIIYMLRGELNNITYMNLMDKLRSAGDSLYIEPRIIHLVKVVFYDENGDLEDKYYVINDERRVTSLTKFDFKKIHSKCCENTSLLKNITDVNISDF